MGPHSISPTHFHFLLFFFPLFLLVMPSTLSPPAFDFFRPASLHRPAFISGHRPMLFLGPSTHASLTTPFSHFPKSLSARLPPQASASLSHLPGKLTPHGSPSSGVLHAPFQQASVSLPQVLVCHTLPLFLMYVSHMLLSFLYVSHIPLRFALCVTCSRSRVHAIAYVSHTHSRHEVPPRPPFAMCHTLHSIPSYATV